MTNWQTPSILFDPLNRACEFAVDAAADGVNTLCDKFYGPGSSISEDALTVPRWLSPAWCNPPYGRGIERWLDKFIEQLQLGNSVVALLPANTEVRWWYEKVVPYSSIIFLVGRVPFHDPGRTRPTQPDHGSALCFYTPADALNRRVEWLDWKERFGNALHNHAVEGEAGPTVGPTDEAGPQRRRIKLLHYPTAIQ